MENVIIPHPEELKVKIEVFKKEGKFFIHILSDFDRTLTKSFSNNQKTPSLISQLRNGNYLSKEYAEKAHDLFNKYHLIEVSQTLNEDEKSKAMLSWWKEHYELLVKSGLDEKTMARAIEDMIKTGSISLRAGADIFLKNLKREDIPLVIMSSSGIGNMVIDFLEMQNLMFSNIHFIGNTLEFDNKGRFIGIKDNKIIHVFNKHEIEIKNLPVYDKIKDRKNIILLGDGLGDLGMLRGLNYNNLIKIGFFNYAEEENLEDFKKNFDIIITNDGSFEYVNELLKDILR